MDMQIDDRTSRYLPFGHGEIGLRLFSAALFGGFRCRGFMGRRFTAVPVQEGFKGEALVKRFHFFPANDARRLPRAVAALQQEVGKMAAGLATDDLVDLLGKPLLFDAKADGLFEKSRGPRAFGRGPSVPPSFDGQNLQPGQAEGDVHLDAVDVVVQHSVGHQGAVVRFFNAYDFVSFESQHMGLLLVDSSSGRSASASSRIKAQGVS